MQSREAELRMSQPSSPPASKHPEQINKVKDDTKRFVTSKENKNSVGREEDTVSRVRTDTESIVEMLQRLSAELDAELQEVDMLSGKLDPVLQKVDMGTGPTLEDLQKQHFLFQ